VSCPLDDGSVVTQIGNVPAMALRLGLPAGFEPAISGMKARYLCR
jgi:hypothetical protein